MKDEGKPVITTVLFDSTAADFILSCFKRKHKMICRFCGEPITRENLAGVTHQGFVCNELPCIIDLTGDDNIASLASQKQPFKTQK
jgi:hypothetical protein